MRKVSTPDDHGYVVLAICAPGISASIGEQALSYWFQLLRVHVVANRRLHHFDPAFLQGVDDLYAKFVKSSETSLFIYIMLSS